MYYAENGHGNLLRKTMDYFYGMTHSGVKVHGHPPGMRLGALFILLFAVYVERELHIPGEKRAGSKRGGVPRPAWTARQAPGRKWGAAWTRTRR